MAMLVPIIIIVLASAMLVSIAPAVLLRVAMGGVVILMDLRVHVLREVTVGIVVVPLGACAAR
eukprot:10542746-Prorocentrum_lima.AAC.1